MENKADSNYSLIAPSNCLTVGIEESKNQSFKDLVE